MKNLQFVLIIFVLSLTDFNLPNPSEKKTKFKNYIVKGERCGHASSGLKCYIKNRDVHNKYEVTIQILKGAGLYKEESTKSYTLKAGEKKYIGCTVSGSPRANGVSIISYCIIGENKLSN